MGKQEREDLPVITNNVVIFEFIPNKISVSRLSPIMIVLSGSKWCLSRHQQKGQHKAPAGWKEKGKGRTQP